jgi:hypothetical protein
MQSRQETRLGSTRAPGGRLPTSPFARAFQSRALVCGSQKQRPRRKRSTAAGSRASQPRKRCSGILKAITSNSRSPLCEQVIKLF